jgi:hypothetical protein
VVPFRTHRGVLGVLLRAGGVPGLRRGAGVKARTPHGVFGLLALVADIVYLLVSAAYGGERLLWFSTAFLLYVLAEALVFFGVTEVALVSVVAAAFCIALPSLPLEPLLRTILVGGALACGAAIYKSHMTTRLATLEARAAGRSRTPRKRVKPSASASPRIFTTARCKASSACKCASRF